MNQDQMLQEILAAVKENHAAVKENREVINFLKDNMVSRDEFQATLKEFKDEIMNHMDGFIGLHQKLDTELTALRSKYDRLESYVHQLAKHIQLDLQG